MNARILAGKEWVSTSSRADANRFLNPFPHLRRFFYVVEKINVFLKMLYIFPLPLLRFLFYKILRKVNVPSFLLPSKAFHSRNFSFFNSCSYMKKQFFEKVQVCEWALGIFYFNEQIQCFILRYFGSNLAVRAKLVYSFGS